jgi:hypothetical protein
MRVDQAALVCVPLSADVVKLPTRS